MADGKLARYQEMRDFSKTAEPPGEAKILPSEAPRFVIQRHAAGHLHFDVRLEYHGTFRSWAAPKGPSLDPHDRRFAMEVEDHPLDYGDFEGTIPKGQYRGGPVMLWDGGYWALEKGFENIGRALGKGELKFVKEGERCMAPGCWCAPGEMAAAGLLVSHDSVPMAPPSPERIQRMLHAAHARGYRIASPDESASVVSHYTGDTRG